MSLFKKIFKVIMFHHSRGGIMKFTLRGTTLQVVDIELQQGESVYTESGGMAWMTPNIDMKSEMKGGLGKALGRVFSGESMFMVNYTCGEGNGLVSFCNEFPGKIVPMKLSASETIICQRDSFLAAEQGVALAMHFNKKLGAGMFGGEGFFLQKITGPGQAFLEFAGEITEYELKANQSLKVNPGYVGAFESTVNFDLTTVSGVKNMLFGGEGFFLATLTGPGKVWLQSMPLRNLAQKLIPYMPQQRR